MVHPHASEVTGTGAGNGDQIGVTTHRAEPADIRTGAVVIVAVGVAVAVVVHAVGAVTLGGVGRGTGRVQPVDQTVAVVVQAVAAILGHAAGTCRDVERAVASAAQRATRVAKADAGLPVEIAAVTLFASVEDAVAAQGGNGAAVGGTGGLGFGTIAGPVPAVGHLAGGLRPAVGVIAVDEAVTVVVLAVATVLHRRRVGAAGGDETGAAGVAGQRAAGESAGDAGLAAEIGTVTDFARLADAVATDRADFAVRRAASFGFSTFAETVAALSAVGGTDDTTNAAQASTVKPVGLAGLATEIGSGFTTFTFFDDSVAADGLGVDAVAVLRAVDVGTIDIAVAIVVDAIVADFDAGLADGLIFAVEIVAVHGTVVVIVEFVVADFLRVSPVATHERIAVRIVAVHLAVAVVVDIVVAVFDGVLAVGGAEAVRVGTVLLAVTIVVDAVVADLLDGTVAAFAAACERILAVRIVAVGLAVAIVVDAVGAVEFRGRIAVRSFREIAIASDDHNHQNQEGVEILLHDISPFAQKGKENGLIIEL